MFGFFLDGTAVSANVATLPDGTVVSINSINNSANDGYYNDNGPGPFPFEYDGFTDVLVASMLGLTAGTHRLTLAIADSGDHSFDSGVFLGAGTLGNSDPSDSVPEPATMLLLGSGLLGLAGFGRKKKFFKKA